MDNLSLPHCTAAAPGRNGGRGRPLSAIALCAKPRLHVLGASGAGTTIVAATLCARHGWTHVDTDVVFWLGTDPPYTDIRPRAGRERAVKELAGEVEAGGWIVAVTL